MIPSFSCVLHISGVSTCLLHYKCILTHSLSDLLIRAFTLSRVILKNTTNTLIYSQGGPRLSRATLFSSSPCVTSHVFRFSRVTLVAVCIVNIKKRREGEGEAGRLSVPTSYSRGDDPYEPLITSPTLEANAKTQPRPPLGGRFIERVGRGREIRVEFESIGGWAETNGR